MKRSRIILGLAGIAATVAGIAWSFAPREPVYHGKPLSYWSQNARAPNEDIGEAYQALHALGPKSVGFLLSQLKKQDSLFQRAYREAWPLLPGAIQKRIPQPRPRDDFLFFWVSGQLLNASAPVPQLLGALHDSNTDVRLAAIWALLPMARHHNMALAVRPIADLLKDSHAEVRSCAALVLGYIAPEHPGLVPALVEGMQGVGLRASLVTTFRMNAAELLGRLGPRASAAIPGLNVMMGHQQIICRAPAAVALWRIAGDTNAIPSLVAALEVAVRNKRPEDPMDCDLLLTSFAELGPISRPAVPILVNLIEFPRQSWPDFYCTNMQQKARLALSQIDPELEKSTKTYLP